MRVMARVSIPVEQGNRVVKDGTIATLMQEMAQRWQPEGMYFTTFDGRRTAYLVLDLPDASDIPSFAEPLFNGLNCELEIMPVMNAEDLQKGMAQLG